MKNEIKQMIYTSERKKEILISDSYKGFEYKVISYGTHPCCYVALPEEHEFYGETYSNIDIECHGGMTFSELWDFGDGKKYYIGWDYAHCYDYMGYYKEYGSVLKENKKWSTAELIEECKKVIEQL